MAELSKSDAELVYKYLSDRVRGDVEYDAYDRALSDWRDDRPDDLNKLEEAHKGSDVMWDWGKIELTMEQSQIDGRDELTPHTYTGDVREDIHELARDFGWDYVKHVRDRIRKMQEESVLSPREFVAFVLSKSRLTYDEAAREMDIESGTFASKMSREVKPEIEAARETVKLAKNLEDG